MIDYHDYLPPFILRNISNLINSLHSYKYKRLTIKNNVLKNKHLGDRCFLLGSGTSIKDIDLTKLENEIVFGLNNFFVHPDFTKIFSNTDISKYYMIAPIHPPQTEEEWREWLTSMNKTVPESTKMLLGLNILKTNVKFISYKYNLFKNHDTFWYFVGCRLKKDTNKKIEVDFTKMLWSSKSVIIYAILCSIYMGFKEIYLLGVDMDYLCKSNESDFRFYKSSKHQQDELKRNNFTQSKIALNLSEVLKNLELIESNNKAKIYNCSKNSLVHCFEKIDFNSISFKS